MTKRQSDGEAYLSTYPRLLKWMNQCAFCQHRGYKPELPEEVFPGFAGAHLRSFFRELELDDRGLCPQCSGAREDS